ncbi:MAG: transposase [Rhabdochlamydiaceae bacterium]
MVTRNKRSAEEKIRIVMESITTNITVAELCRKYNIQPPAFYQWKERFMEGGKMALTGRNGDAAKHLQKENESLKRIVGELTMANDLFKKTLKGNRR